MLSLFCLSVLLICSRASTPPFVAHVTSSQLEAAEARARDFHDAAIRRALDNYPVNDVPLGEPINNLSYDQVKNIDSPGALPDFDGLIPKKVHVADLLTEDECRHAIQLAEDHFQRTNQGEWPSQTSGQYQVRGFYIQSVPTVHQWFLSLCRQRLFPQLAATFPEFCKDAADLCVDGAYLFKYMPSTGGRTDIHTDSGSLTFTISLNDDYKGGGTYFEGLVQDNSTDNNSILTMKAGQVTLRPGGVKHCGYPVSSGERYIIGGFCMHRRQPEVVRQLMLQSENVELLEAAVKCNPRCDVGYNILAGAYQKHGDLKKAEQVLSYCLDHVHPSAGEVVYSLGSLKLEKGDLERARQCFDICLQVDEYDVDAMLSMAEVCNKLDDRAAEEAYFHRVVATPGANKKALATAYSNLGVLYEGQDAEIEYYQRSIECVNDSFVPHYSLGAAYACRKEYERAIASFRRAVTLAPTPERETQALQSLYKVCVLVLQENPPPSGGQQEMMQQFVALMGQENYQKLAASARR